MSRLERLATVMQDFGLLSAPDQRMILAALSFEERSAWKRLSADRATEASPSLHSPWFEQLVAVARRGKGGMTAHARDALLATLENSSRPVTAARPSLLQAVGSALLQARARR